MTAAPGRRPIAALLAAQGMSALADNALLIVAIAQLERHGLPGWWAPLLKLVFTIAYVLLAPLAGPLADAMPKARLMAWMNALKAAGAAALLAGGPPLPCYAVVGLGAALYAPAKYGLITELLPARRLVAANAWIEVTVVGAVLFGTALGGLLVSPWVTEPLPAVVLLSIYGLAALQNRAVPDSGARYPRGVRRPLPLLRDFGAANRRLWADREGGLSLAATTLFWGVGATLQFMVLDWSAVVLGLPLHQGALLQAVAALGVVLGAAVAGRWVPLARAGAMLGAGVLLGGMLPLLSLVRSVPLAVALLVLTGALGGLMLVPLNALLQHRGCQLLSAGRSIAVQGFNENASVLLMLAGYALLSSRAVPVQQVMQAGGLAIAAAMAALMLAARFRPRPA